MNRLSNLAAASEFLPKCLPGLLPVPNDDGTPTILTHLSDPGHGWLVVSRALAADVFGIHNAPGSPGLGLVSPYSYEVPTDSGPVLLLEEDCDASLFLALWEQQPAFGSFTVANVECPDSIDVRALPRFAGSAPDRQDKAWQLLSDHYRAKEGGNPGADA